MFYTVGLGRDGYRRVYMLTKLVKLKDKFKQLNIVGYEYSV